MDSMLLPELKYNILNYIEVGDTSNSDAFNRIIAGTSGNIRIYLPGPLTFATPIVITGNRSILIEGDGIGISVVSILHSGSAISITSTSIFTNVTIRDITFNSTCNLGSLSAISASFPAVATASTINFVAERLDIRSNSTTVSNTIKQGIVLSGAWSARFNQIQMQNQTITPNVNDSCLVNLSNCMDSWVTNCSLTNGAALVLQTGYCENIKLDKNSAFGTDYLFNQDLTAQNSYGGFAYYNNPNSSLTLKNISTTNCRGFCWKGGINITNGDNLISSKNHWSRYGDNSGFNDGINLTNFQNGIINSEIFDGGSDTGLNRGLVVSGTSTAINISSCNFSNSTNRVIFGPNTSQCHANLIFADSDPTGNGYVFDQGTNNTILWHMPNGGTATSSVNGWSFGGNNGQTLLNIAQSNNSDTWIATQAATGSASIAPASANANADLILSARGTGSVKIGNYALATQNFVNSLVILNILSYVQAGDASHSDALTRLINNTTGNIRIRLPGALTFAQPVTFSGDRSIELEGDGPGVTVITISHNGIWLNCTLATDSDRVTLRNATFLSNSPNSTHSILCVTGLPATGSSSASHVCVENLQIYSAGNTIFGQIYRGITLIACWGSRIRNIQMQGLSSYTPTPGSCVVEIGTSTVDTWLRDISGTYMHSVIFQTGYSEGFRINGISALATNWLFDQDSSQLNSANGFSPTWAPFSNPGYPPNNETLNGFWLSECETACFDGGIRITNGLVIFSSGNHWGRYSDTGGLNDAINISNTFNCTITNDIFDGGADGALNRGLVVSGSSNRVNLHSCQFANITTRIYFGSGTSACHADMVEGDTDTTGTDYTIDQGTNNSITWRMPNGGSATSKTSGWVFGGNIGQNLLVVPQSTNSDTWVAIQASNGATSIAAVSQNANADLVLDAQGSGNVKIGTSVVISKSNLVAMLEAIAPTLPTVEPTTSDILWLNGGLIAIT